MALVASPTPAAQAAEAELRQRYEFVAASEADVVIALGGDGFMLQTLHGMLDQRQIYRVCYGLLVLTALKLLWDGVSGYIA